MSIENPSGEVSVHRPTNLEDLRSEMPSFMKNMQSRNMCFPKVQEGCTKVNGESSDLWEGCCKLEWLSQKVWGPAGVLTFAGVGHVIVTSDNRENDGRLSYNHTCYILMSKKNYEQTEASVCFSRSSGS